MGQNSSTRTKLLDSPNRSPVRRPVLLHIGPNLFHQNRTVSWLILMPRSCRRSSTLRSESGKRTYSITAKRMISGLVLKYLNGEYFVMRRGYETALPASSSFCLTEPPQDFSTGLFGSVFGSPVCRQKFKKQS